MTVTVPRFPGPSGAEPAQFEVVASIASCGVVKNTPGNISCTHQPIPRSDPSWSHSSRCDVWDFVQDDSQRVLSKFSPFQLSVTVALLPAMGQFGDMCGRKPMLIVGSAAQFIEVFFVKRTATATG